MNNRWKIAVVALIATGLGMAPTAGADGGVERAIVPADGCFKSLILARWSCAPKDDSACWVDTGEEIYYWWDKCLAENPGCVIVEE